MDAAPNERGPPPAYSQFEMRPLAGNTLEEAELLHAMSYVPNWKDAILDRLGSSRCHRTITSFLITCITTTVIGLAFCFVMQYENSYWYKVTLDNDTSLRAVGFRHEDIRPDLLLDNLKLSHRLTFKSQHLFSTRFVPFYLRSIKTKVTVLSDPKFEKLSDKYVKQGNRENFHYQGIVQLILTWNNAEDYLDFNVDRVLFHVQYILIVASSAAGPSKVVKFNKFFTQQIDLEAVLRAGGTVRGSTHILGRVKVPDGLRVEKILKNKKKRIG